MAVLTGGLHGRPRGNVAGVVYGGARGRAGKLVTAREKVDPSNPKTAGQVTQREKFERTLNIVRLWAPDIYQSDWNRAVGQLPGFQSMHSLLLNAIGQDHYFVAKPANTPLGILHLPDTLTVESTGANEFTVTWSAETGDNGNVADELRYAWIKAADDITIDQEYGVDDTTEVRNGSPKAVTVAASSKYLVVVWMRGTAIGNAHLSIAEWFLVDTEP